MEVGTQLVIFDVVVVFLMLDRFQSKNPVEIIKEKKRAQQEEEKRVKLSQKKRQEDQERVRRFATCTTEAVCRCLKSL